MKLVPTTSFQNLEPVADGGKARSMKERIAQAKQNGNLGYTERVQQPTSRISLVVSEGEGRTTREAEIIYWPKLYAVSKRCKFLLHLFVIKCELQ